MTKHLAPVALLLAAFLAGAASAQDDGLPPLPPRQHGENHNPKAAKWAELFKNMPDEKTSCAGLDVFYGQLAVDYKAKTKDQGAAKEAGMLAIERFAESFVHLRDLPMAFEEVLELVGQARAKGAKDPLLDLVEMLGHMEVGRVISRRSGMVRLAYTLPCFSAKALLGMRDAVKAQYKEGVAMVMAEGMLIYCASDWWFPCSSMEAHEVYEAYERVNAQVDPQAFMDAYAALATAYAKGPGLQSGLLDCWLWTIHDKLGDYVVTQIGAVKPTSIPNMFLEIDDPKALAKHELFWGVAWEKQAFHPDLIQALKAIQAYHAGCEAKDRKLVDAEQVFQAKKTAAVDILRQIQFKNDASNGLLLAWTGSDYGLTFPGSLRMVLETGFGPRFLQSATQCKQMGGYADQQKKRVALAWILDEAQASERDEIAPPIAQLIGQFFEVVPIGAKNPDLEEWLSTENIWPDLDTVFTRAWSSLARRPEHWAQVRARDLFIHHLDLALAAKQTARVRALLAQDAKRQTRLLDEAMAKTILGPQWQAILDRQMAKGHPDFGTELALLEENTGPSDEDLKKQIQTLVDWEKHAGDAMTRRHLQRLLTQRRWLQGASVDLPFDGVHWNVGNAKIGADGLVRMTSGHWAIAQLPLDLSEKGMELAFDLHCPAHAPAVLFKLALENDRFDANPFSSANADVFFLSARGALTSPLFLFGMTEKGGRPTSWLPSDGVPAAKVAAGQTVHVRLEYWYDYQFVWVDGRLASCFARAPDFRPTNKRFLELSVEQVLAILKPEQCIGISPVRITPLGASPRSWLPDHFEAVVKSYPIRETPVFSALPLDPDAEIPDPLPWAKAALARDPGHEVALALLIKAGQGPKWETLPAAIQQRLLAACPVNPELTEYLKPHRPAPANKPAKPTPPATPAGNKSADKK